MLAFDACSDERVQPDLNAMTWVMIRDVSSRVGKRFVFFVRCFARELESKSARIQADLRGETRTFTLLSLSSSSSLWSLLLLREKREEKKPKEDEEEEKG